MNWQKEKPEIKCFFVARIWDEGNKEMQYNLFEERLDGNLYNELGEDCNEYLGFEKYNGFLIIENKSQNQKEI